MAAVPSKISILLHSDISQKCNERALGSVEAGHFLLSDSLKFIYEDETLFIQRSNPVLRAPYIDGGSKQIGNISFLICYQI